MSTHVLSLLKIGQMPNLQQVHLNRNGQPSFQNSFLGGRENSENITEECRKLNIKKFKMIVNVF